MHSKSKTPININPGETRKILIMNLGGIGDFLFSLPALRTLRDNFKDAQIVLLTIPRTLPLAKDYTYLSEVLSFDLRLHHLLPLLLSLRAKRFDLALNMRTLVSWRSAFKMAIIFYLIHPKHKVGRDTARRGFFFDLKIPEEEIGDKPEYEYDLKTIEALGVKAEYSPPEMAILESDVAYINNFLIINEVSENDILIGINPGAPHSTKRWPVENFAKVINILSEKNSCKIIITGSADELSIARKLQSLSKSELIIATGETSIQQLIALIKKCHLYITNDTGPMHIAAILKTPLVAIFGPGYLKRFDPRNISNLAVVLYKKVDCAPCDKVICRSMQCLKAISPAEVVEATLSLLKREKQTNQ